MNVNYDSVCRLCLSSRCELLPIFSTTSSDDCEPLVLASKIKDCVSVQINENDCLPTNVCRKCVDNVNNWHIFKGVCERTQNKLEVFFNKESNQLEEVQIKSEPIDEAYDDGVVIDGSYVDSENAGPSIKVQPEGPPILASLGLTPRSDKKYVDPRMDWQRVHAILNMVQDDEVIDSLQSIEECDVVHQSDHDSDTDLDLNNDLKDDFADCKSGYICRNKMLLSKNPKLSCTENFEKVKKVINLRQHYVQRIRKYYSCPKDAWQVFISDDLLELIVTSTNEKILSNKMKIASTNVSEIKTLFGILYYHGIMRPTCQKTSDLWHTDYGVQCVRNAMKYERFKFLVENMRFEREDSEIIIELDIMKRIRKVFEIFALNCRSSFDSGNMVVIDEVILPIHGPCPFRYTIKKKELKNGLKLVLVVDPDNFYVSNLDVITDPYFGKNEIAMKLLQHLAGSWKTVIMDNWFSSLSLMDRLVNEYQLFTIAAVDENCDILPPVFLSHYRKQRTFLTGFLNDEVSITSYVHSGSKTVNIVTNEPKFYKRGHGDCTTVVSQYKKNQSAVDVLDVLMNYYTTMQHCNDWTLSVLFMLLNIATINAQVLWSSGHISKTIVQRRLFIRELAISLMETNEPTLQTTPELKKRKFSTFEHMTPSYKSRRRCKLCFLSTKRDRRTKQYCHKCGTFICREHTVSICTTCTTPA